MKLIAFKDKFPNRISKLLLYNDVYDKYEICYFGSSPFKEHNTYLYLIKLYTHWMYCNDLPKP